MRYVICTSMLLTGLILSGCASNPNKVQNLDTTLEKDNVITGDTRLGIKDGNFVVQTKTLLTEDLRNLQYEVYGLEYKVYGNPYGTKGIYGVLKDCHKDLSSKKYGGDGKLAWMEPIDRVADKEETLNLGIDEKDAMVAVSEEGLKERILRFREYKKIYEKREADLQNKLEMCELELANRKYDLKLDSKPAVKDIAHSSTDAFSNATPAAENLTQREVEVDN